MDAHPNAATDRLDARGVEAGDAPAPRRLATDRLALVRAHPDDVAFDRLHALFADVTDADDVFALCGWDEHGDEAATRAYLDDRAERWERGDFFEYVLESSADGEFVGTACVEVDGDGAGEFGLWLRKPHWGCGFSREATDALVHVTFECLDAPYFVAGCLAANHRSRRAIEAFVRRYGGAYYGSPPTVSSSAGDGTDGENTVASRHEWVVTRDQYESGDHGLSTLVPGVAYDDVTF